VYFDNLTACFVKYLETKGIKQIDNFEDETKCENITTSMIKEQIYIISEFHKNTLGYTGKMNKRLDNNIGKTVEQYKVYVKKLNRDLEKLRQKELNNEFEKALLKKGDLYLIRAKDCIDSIYENNYISLIARSMKKVEMCLGNTYFNNLRKKETIEVKNVDGCCYNMVEMDLVFLLGKIKRKGISVDFDSLIREFCELETLDSDSISFIRAAISYPYEFVRCCNRYREKSKDWTEDQYILKLQKAIMLDGESLI
jgi:hypothetical protein